VIAETSSSHGAPSTGYGSIGSGGVRVDVSSPGPAKIRMRLGRRASVSTPSRTLKAAGRGSRMRQVDDIAVRACGHLRSWNIANHVTRCRTHTSRALQQRREAGRAAAAILDKGCHTTTCTHSGAISSIAPSNSRFHKVSGTASASRFVKIWTSLFATCAGRACGRAAMAVRRS